MACVIDSWVTASTTECAPSPFVSSLTLACRPGRALRRAEPAGAEHVGGREQTRDQIVGGEVWGGDEGAFGKRDPQQLSLRAEAPIGTRLTQALW
jgi:hypothetical protein